MKKVLNFIKKQYKYVIVILLFAVMILYVSDFNIFVIHRLQREVAAINRESELIQKEIEKEQADQEALLVNPSALEAYGRENYYMKRANEDIFIIHTEE